MQDWIKDHPLVITALIPLWIAAFWTAAGANWAA